MADPFALAADALFASALAEDVTYQQPDGAPYAVRIIRGTPDVRARFGDSQTIMRSITVDVRRSEVASPKLGDVFHVGEDEERGTVLRLTGEPELDVEGVTWRCPAEEYDA